MKPLAQKVINYVGPQLRMPWWIFWSILLSLTWYYIVRRVISWDLWWHMAAGRFILENGAYPETGTFTFSPVKDTNFTEKTWFGDIILHLTHSWFGFYGLQILRGTFILSSVGFMLHLVKFRYNIWTLLISSMMIIGTMQKHLMKNAIIIIPAMSFLTWSWVQIRYHKKYYLLYFYPILFLIWAPFHGSVMVGACFLFAIYVGEIYDSVIIPFHSKLNSNLAQKFFSSNYQYVVYLSILLLILILGVTNFVLLIIPFIILLPIYIIFTLAFPNWTKTALAHSYENKSTPKFLLIFSLVCWPIFIFVHASAFQLPFLKPFNPAFVTVGLLEGPKSSGKIVAAVKANTTKKKSESQLQQFLRKLDQVFDNNKPLKSRLKDFFRIVFTGTDAKLVAEYQWPFEILYVLSVKALFLFVVVFLCYSLFRIAIGLHDLKFSFELPSLALIYLSLGYLRTLSYPFVTAAIFLCFSIYHGHKWLDKSNANRATKGWILVGLNFFLVFMWAVSPLFSEFVELFFNALKDNNTAKDARFIAIPILFLPLAIGLLLTLKNQKSYNLGMNILLPSVGIYTFACLMYFANYQYSTYKAGNFHTVTGFLDTEPGLGKSNKFFDGMAEWVQEELPPKNIYNSYNMGGYLLWKWYGDRKVFIDGRSIIYENDFYKAYTTNNAQKYIEKEGLEHAILNTVVDKDRILIFSRQGWYPIHFDPCMVILKKPSKYEEPFGIIPEFHEGERPVEDLENLDRLALAELINTSVHHMMLYGRMKDAHDYMNSIKDLIEKIPEAKKKLNDRLNHIKLVGQNFGFHNHRAMAALSKQIFNKVQGVKYHQAMGEAHFALKQYPQAEGQFGRAFNLKKNDVKILTRMGETLYLQKKYDKSVSFFAEGLKHKPKDPLLHNSIVLPLIELKKYDQALMSGQNAIKLSPNFAEAYFNVGRVYLKKKDPNRAIPFFQKALQLKPNFAEANNILQQLAAEQAKQKKAIKKAPEKAK